MSLFKTHCAVSTLSKAQILSCFWLCRCFNALLNNLQGSYLELKVSIVLGEKRKVSVSKKKIKTKNLGRLANLGLTVNRCDSKIAFLRSLVVIVSKTWPDQTTFQVKNGTKNYRQRVSKAKSLKANFF